MLISLAELAMLKNVSRAAVTKKIKSGKLEGAVVNHNGRKLVNKEFYENELIRLLEKHNFKLIESRPILPEPTMKGNFTFIVYRFLEYIFFILTKPFVSKGYSKNLNMIFENN